MGDFLENLFNHVHGAASLFATTALFVGLAVALLATQFGCGWHPSVPGTGLTGSSHPHGHGFPRRGPPV